MYLLMLSGAVERTRGKMKGGVRLSLCVFEDFVVRAPLNTTRGKFSDTKPLYLLSGLRYDLKTTRWTVNSSSGSKIHR